VTVLTTMALDNAKIGCRCFIQAGKSESYILTVISHDDYLPSDGNRHNDTNGSVDLDIGVLKMINIEDAVKNYLVSIDRSEDHLQHLSSLFAGCSKWNDVQVVVSQSLVACGNGRLIMEISFSDPKEYYKTMMVGVPWIG
jgi:hypothetical protein